MCGIVALFARKGQISESSLDRATQRLEHRGPDGQKTWISPHRKVGLGHARLSIIDLTTGDQPIANETNSLHIVVNGEFYDYERIQRELQQRGHQLRTRTDSEIAFHLYEELGTHCLEHLRASLLSFFGMSTIKLYLLRATVSGSNRCFIRFTTTLCTLHRKLKLFLLQANCTNANL